MKLSETSIRRPVFATVLSLLVVLVGMVSFTRLPVREYPDIDEPVVTVDTTYRGASPEIIESTVTQPLEESLAGIEGIRTISSISRQERSQITVRFRLHRDADNAAADVRDRVGRVRADLPAGIDEPIVAKVEADASPIIFIGFTSDRHSSIEITDYIERLVKDRLQALPGVAEIQLFADRPYAMRIWLAPDLMAAHAVTLQDVEAALRAQNLDVPGGRIESTDREFTVLNRTELRDPEEFEQIILRQDAAHQVLLGDVARVELGTIDVRELFRFSGRDAVSIGIVKQSAGNPIDISRALQRLIPGLRAALPEGMNLEIGYNTSVFIETSIENVFWTIAEAVVLVLVVIFLFLRSLRATLVPLVTIPISLIGGFALMQAMGFSINTLTLLAMVLAIGLVVDDAIVMLENIHRYVERGRSPFEAALKGSREIGFAVVAMTVTLAAVYVPVTFMEGRTGRLFSEFALTLAGVVLVSGLVALSLSPMMCVKLLKPSLGTGRLYRVGELLLERLNSGYRHLLEGALRARLVVLLAAGAAGAVGVLAYSRVGLELAPVEDRGGFFVAAIAPQGATLNYVDDYARRIERVFTTIPEMVDYFIFPGYPVVTQVAGYVNLKPWAQRNRKQQEIVADIAPRLFELPGALAFPLNPPSFGAPFFDKPVQFVLQSTGSYEELDAFAQRIIEAAASNPGLRDIETDLKLNSPQLRTSFDRRLASDLGLEIGTIARSIETAMAGREVTRFRREGEEYDVILKIDPAWRATPSQIESIHLRTASGQMIPLAAIVAIEEAVAPQELNRFGQLRAVKITANLAPGYALGDALTFLEETAAAILPPGVTADYDGQSREFRESSASLAITFVLALAFIYLVLAAQFESFIDPLIILISVPLSLVGALAALWATGSTLNIYSQIGLVTLIGLITKHGILIVEFANQLQAQGRDRPAAVLEAAVLRLRPILMTTGAMVLGAVPLAFAHGAGAESRQQIGWVIVGGMTLGTLLTLFVVPAVYSLLARRREKGSAVLSELPVT